MEVRPHLKPNFLFMTPPSREARQLPCAGMALVDETSRNTPWPPIQIFITAPHREISSPVVKPQRNISSGVRQVKSHNAAFAMPCLRDCRHVEGLPGRVVDPAQQDQRDRIAVSFDQRFDIFVTHASLAVARSEFEQRGCGIEPMET